MTEDRAEKPFGTHSKNAFQKAAGDVIAQRIESIAFELRSVSDPAGGMLPSNETLSILASTMQSMLKKVDALFEIDGFSTSPACMIVLELFQAKVRGEALPIATLQDVVNCPSSVVYRWVDILESKSLLEKLRAEGGSARVCLTQRGYLKTAEALQLLL